GSVPMVTYDVRVHRESDLDAVRNWCTQHNVAIAGAGTRKLRIYLLQGSSAFSAIANLTEVEKIEEYVPPQLWNDRAAVLLKVIDSTGTSIGFDGEGQIIGIADTGI